MKTFKQIWDEAVAAATAAGTAARPEPMGVTDGKTTWVIADGPCGFAWVTFAGNTAFGRWAVKNTNARKSWPKGIAWNVSMFNQSLDRKTAAAYAFARVLRANGIEAWADSRID